MKRKRGRGRPGIIESLVAQVEEGFESIKLPRRYDHPKTLGAQTRLNGALSTVNNVFLTMNLSRAVDRSVKKKELRGRLSQTQLDILRAAIVFAGAGLDAALKKLIADTVREIAVNHERARRKLLDFIDTHLASAVSPVNRRSLAEILIDDQGPKEALLHRYERALTGDSLQAVDQVRTVCGALAVADRAIHERLKEGSTLDEMFKARNDVVHQLDLTDNGPKPRKLEDVRRYAEEALSVTQEIINAVGRGLRKR